MNDQVRANLDYRDALALAIQALAADLQKQGLTVRKVVVEGQFPHDLFVQTIAGEVTLHWDGTNVLQKKVDRLRDALTKAMVELDIAKEASK